ncbi:uncharacterized protein LOC8051328 [Ixodes scapularis]|uniref:uncharacterized protein LOC8051328 n=1 Tax=Ixodes scapularis TaxID=6945 RepID=UPI001C3903C5|nr:uncharacterized protein LOC8051328 [Ixodes scapularis]
MSFSVFAGVAGGGRKKKMAEGGDLACARPLFVTGFSASLDWRPMLFQEAVIAQSACSLCGLVSRKAVKLPCAHTLCSECQADCVQRGNCCPLDQGSFCEDDLIQHELSEAYLGKRRVACWNASHGCGFVGPVSGLVDHYQGCAFHAVSCPRCESHVLRSGIVDHCRDDCCSVAFVSEAPATTGALYSRDAAVERACDEVKEVLARISDDIASLQTSVNRCCEDVRAVDAGCRQQLEAQSSSLRNLDAVCAAGFAEQRMPFEEVATRVAIAVSAASDKNEQVIVRELNAWSHKLSAATARVSQDVLRFCGPKTYHWYPDDWAAKKAKALAGSMEFYESPAWNAHDYVVSMYVKILRKENQQLCVGCYMCLHPGSKDSDLEWPFSKVYKLGIVHPRDRSKLLSCEIDASKHKEDMFLRKPKERKHWGVGTPLLCTTEKIDAGGFADGDMLHFFLKVYP